MKIWQVWWKVDWSNETYYRECHAESKDDVVRLYNLNTADVTWYNIKELAI